jgi:L-asparaginase
MGASEKTPAPSALDVAAYAVSLLEDNGLFNSAHGAVFTRDGINELEASVMVSRGYKKRGVGVTRLRHVRNPVLLAREMLVRGEGDLETRGLDVPSAQGHGLVCGEAAEQLARVYGLDMVEPGYFFTQQRWDEHVRALATWSPDEYLPQGTCGAVALDGEGVVCAATSTGGMTNKLTGRIGDTPVVGAGFWAEEWCDGETETETETETAWDGLARRVRAFGPGVSFAGPLRGLLADCLAAPLGYLPLDARSGDRTVTCRSMGASGTGNGDSFLRISAVRSVAAMARWKPESSARAMAHVVGPEGELQRSAGDRWGRTGEGEGGMIGIESIVERDAETGRVVGARSEILMDYNCGGMYRAWVDDEGRPRMSIWSNGGEDPENRA